MSRPEPMELGITVPAGKPGADIFLAPSCQAANMISNFDAALVHKWISNCRSNHQGCALNMTNATPTRLIEVFDAQGSPSARLIVADQTEGHKDYAALSYCWGQNNHSLTTTTNIDDLVEQIDVSNLPKTYRDAIEVCHGVGLRYLWIDALCIIQDDGGHDKRIELTKMHLYYRNATLTIVASMANNVHDGFIYQTDIFNTTRSLDYIQKTLPLLCTVPIYTPKEDHFTVTLEAGISRHLPCRDPVNARAWCLQERLMSPRTLHFATPTGLTMMCETEERHNERLFYSRVAWSGVCRSMFKPSVHHYSLGETEPAMLLAESWLDLVNDYCARKMTDPDDKLIAISSLAYEYGTKHGQQLGTYVAGHWSNFLAHSLGWEANHGPKPAPAAERAPSWSWAAVEGALYMPISKRSQPEACRLRVINYEATAVHEENPFGPVRSGSIRVRSKFKGSAWFARYETIAGKTARDGSEEYQRFSSCFIQGDANPRGRKLHRAVPDSSECIPSITKPVAAVYLLVLYDDLDSTDRNGLHNIDVTCLVLQHVEEAVFRRIGIIEDLWVEKEKYLLWKELEVVLV
ncbi:hypothetical protein H2200_001605 [Cladophialophora chaetospira]|uniref:Heterokaryon incompatibility domain-containing protein n=1 Tax=Cladophialophora chaetospira TaxID=386627 RepID=A0AA38XM04_9EURO|nr:hypothetical protein H2200_001605 [Cladophialophora chaetospira]